MLLIATTNPGKLREFADLLGDLRLPLASLADFPGAPSVPEEGATYRENALRKAVTLARWSQCPTLADDSGLEVDALQGAPGVHSARYAGPAQDNQANIDKLLSALTGVPSGQRLARFRAVIAVARPDGATLIAEGVCNGRIAEARRGTGGFGYDAVFWYPPAAMTFAELPAAVKNRVSHRAAACADLRRHLAAFLAAAPSSVGTTAARRR